MKKLTITSDPKLMVTSSLLIMLFIIGFLAEKIAVIDGLIPFGPHDVSRSIEIYAPPGTVEITEDGKTLIHYLGTDDLGRDVASRLIHGITVAFKVGIFSTLISLFIALVLGGVSGYKGDNSDKINIGQLIWLFIGLFFTHYYAYEYSYKEGLLDSFDFQFSTYLLLVTFGILIIYIIFRAIGKLKFKSFYIPYDFLVLKLLEVFKSIPGLFMILAIFSIVTRPSLMAVVLIIGLIRWPTLTRLIRAEVLKARQENYVNSAILMGLPSYKVVFNHIVPNIYKSILILSALSAGDAILIESSLSFLQIGLPIDEVSWGRMLETSRDYIPAWWLAIGPGSLIFIMILSFKILADRLSYHFGIEKSL